MLDYTVHMLFPPGTSFHSVQDGNLTDFHVMLRAQSFLRGGSTKFWTSKRNANKSRHFKIKAKCI